MTPAQLSPCGSIGFSGAVPGGLQTCNDGTEAYVVGAAVVVQRQGERSVLEGAGKVVACMAVSRSGRLLATGHRTAVGLSAEVTVWDLAAGTLLHHCCLHKAKVQGLAFSPCEAILASVGGPDDNALVLWSTTNGAPICGAAVPAAAAVAFFSARSDRLVTCGRYSLLVWEVVGGKLAPLEVQLGLLQRCYTSLAIDEADEILYVATSSGDVATVSLPRRMLRRTGPPPAAKRRGKDPGPGGPLSAATTLMLVPNGGPLLVGGADGRVLVMPRDCPTIDVRSGSRLPILAEGRLPGGVSSLALRAGGSGARAAFLAGTKDGDVFEMQHDGAAVLTHERVRTAPQHALTDVAFAPGYRAVFATAGGSDVRLWALDSQAELLRICEPGLVCSCLAFSADGSALVSGWSDGRIRAYGPQSGRPAYVIHDAHQLGVSALAAAASGRRLISGGGDGAVRVWRVGESQELVASMKEHKAAVTGLRLTRGDAECASAGADGVCIVWDLRTFARRTSLTSQVLSAVVYHPDESQLVTTGAQQVTYWDALDGQAIRVLDAACRLAALAVHPGGELLAAGGEDRVVRLLNYDEGDVRAACVGHSGAVTQLAFVPEGDAGAGAPKTSTGGTGGATGKAAVANLVSVDDQGSIKMWQVPRALLRKPAAA